jgi:acylphosphatase
MDRKLAKRWFVSGRVQGVGFRYFVQERAINLGIEGWTRNLDDGRMEVYAVGTAEQLNHLAAALHSGPRSAQVRGVEENEAPMEKHGRFSVR